MVLVNGIIAMLSVIVASVVNSTFLVVFIAGLAVGFVRARSTIGTALAFDAPLVTPSDRALRVPVRAAPPAPA